MTRSKPRIEQNFSFKNCISITLFFMVVVNAADYDVKDYGYDYYDDYDPLYDSDEYMDTGHGFAETYYYEDEPTNQERSKKELGLKDMNWINRSLASLVDPDCEIATTPKPASNPNCEPEVSKETTTTKAATETTTVCIPVAAPTAAPTAAPITCEPEQPKPSATDCISVKASLNEAVQGFRAPIVSLDQDEKAKELRNMVQRLYIAQARVQLEASEIKKAQAIANEAQQQLEESANHVRAITAALQNAQQEVASSAIRAQTAQLQLAAHDQLLFAARQDVDALSSQMVGLQAAEGIAQPKANFDISALMDKLRQPLLKTEKPTPIPTIMAAAKFSNFKKKKKKEINPDYYYDDDYYNY